MRFDVIFLDTVAPKEYDNLSLQHEPMGGTEATVIRIAETLGAMGLEVAVAQSLRTEPIQGQYCLFIPASDLQQHETKNLVAIRSINGLELFPNANKYVWLHDVADERLEKWVDTLKETNAEVVGVSSWHKSNIEQHMNYDKCSFIYNPVQNDLYNVRPKYDVNTLVWMSSPHKGLEKALEVFARIRNYRTNMVLKVFNPGYLNLALIIQPGVQVYGAVPAKEMWSHVAQSLAVLYPTDYKETFGLVAAEANALGVPFAAYKNAALAETVSSEEQFSENEDRLVDKVVNWAKHGRPTVEGQERFKLSNIARRWIDLFKGVK